MIKNLFYYIFILFLLNTNIFAYDVFQNWEQDKKEHFISSGTMGLFFESTLEQINRQNNYQLNGITIVSLSVVTTMIPGVAKELLDSREVNNKFDTDDLFYDFAGSIVGTMTSYVVNRFFDTEKYNISLVNPKNSNLDFSINFKF